MLEEQSNVSKRKRNLLIDKIDVDINPDPSRLNCKKNRSVKPRIREVTAGKEVIKSVNRYI